MNLSIFAYYITGSNFSGRIKQQIRIMIGLFVRNTGELPTMMLRRLVNVRFLSQTNRTLEKSESSTPPSPPSSQTPSTETAASTAHAWQKTAQSNYKPSNFEKRLLVWSGKYKSMNDIPERVAWVYFFRHWICIELFFFFSKIKLKFLCRKWKLFWI